MRLESVELRNFRCFESFTLQLNGESLFVVAPNAGGKTSLLNGIRGALHGLVVTHRDFRDLAVPVELIATLSAIPADAQGAFADAIDFSTSPPTLRIGTRGIWDPDEREIESVHGYPDQTWQRARREAREKLALLFLPAWRDPARLTAVVGRQSMLDELISGLALDEELEQAVIAIATAGQQLARAAPLQELLATLSAELKGFLPDVVEHAYTLGLDVSRPEDILRELELLLAHRGPGTPVADQSSGLTQASVFALALALLARKPDALLLVDEPEAALHPQAQRALVAALRDRAEQSVIATHSAAVLDRVDPRSVLRLRLREQGDTESVRASSMPAENATRLSRYATSHTAEAYFAETVVLVEGFSDLLAVRVIAQRTGVNLDASGVTLLSLEGGGLFTHYLQLLGPQGLDLRLRGLCDLDAEALWMGWLGDAGLEVGDRDALNAAGVQVCEPDLEAELMDPLSETQIEQVFAADGAAGEFTSFAGQPENRGSPQQELQIKFVRKNKIRWAPLLAAALPDAHLPAPVTALLGSL